MGRVQPCPLSSSLMNRTLTPELSKKMSRIELLILDVDGVLTNGQIYYGSNGFELKAFDVQDGYALKMLHNIVQVAIISGRNSEITTRRASELNIDYVFQGEGEKEIALNKLIEITGINRNHIAHVGDDIPDLAVFEEVGISFAPANANPVLLKKADFVTNNTGGNGAVREICELLLTAKNLWKF